MAKEQIYPYAVARIRMLERTLLTEKSYLQMAEAKTVEEALKILAEFGYGEGEPLSIKNYEVALSNQLAKAYKDVEDLIKGQNLMDVFLLKNDYHNIKVFMKEELSGVDGSKYIVGGGTVKADLIKTAFDTKSFDLLPVNMADAISKAYEAYGKTVSGQMIDIVMDRAAFKDISESAAKSQNNFVKKYVTYICDITNLKSFLRIRSMKKSIEMMTEVFIYGGDLGIDVFRQAFGTENIALAFKNTQYASLTENMANGFTSFEKQCDNYLMAFVRDAKYKSLTLEPMVAYVYARETEVKTARIILSSKVNSIDPEIIKERLRDAYV